VTAKACCVRVEARRDRERDAATFRSVTRSTRLSRDCAAARVRRVVEAHAKGAHAREVFERARLRVRVTDCADGARRIRELLRVAAGAGRVARKLRARRVVFTLVAEKTWKTRVLRVRVSELREVNGALRLAKVRGELRVEEARGFVCVLRVCARIKEQKERDAKRGDRQRRERDASHTRARQRVWFEVVRHRVHKLCRLAEGLN